jgi:gamma-glutamylaminecyclotransferase
VIRLFVYGSLQSGERNHGVLGGARYVGRARTRPEFELVDMGSFPALVPDGEIAVHGEVYELEAGPALARVDQLEGHPRFYERTPIVLADGSQAETYLMKADRVIGYRRIASGCWRTTRVSA